MRYPPETIARHVSAYRAGDLTAAEYCREHRLNYWTFLEWRKRKPSRPAADLSFVKVALPAPVSPACLEIITRTGATVRIPAEIDAIRARLLLGAVKRSGIA